MSSKNRNRRRRGGAGKPATATAEPTAGAAHGGPTPARGRKPRPASTFNALPVLLVLVAAGVLLTAYLTGVKLAGGELAACAAGSSCDLVQSSRWSELLGLPIAFWGMLTYLATGVLLWRSRRHPRAWVHAMFVALVGVVISAYLQAVSVFVIDALCVYCIVSALLLTSIFVLLAVARPVRVQGFRWASFAPSTLLLAAALATGLHLHYSGVFDPTAGPEDPYLRGLAEHLGNEGALFYGAYWCPHCQEQKALFAASVDRLPYVECSPDGRGKPRAVECETRRIETYPTWIIGGKRHEGVLRPQRLAELSGYQP